MKRLSLALVAAVLVLIAGPVAAEDVPNGITTQGVLRNAAGNVVNGVYSLTFKLYTAKAEGQLLWSEVQDDVAVENGIYTALLGQTSPLPASLFANNVEVWLGVSVEGQQELPRAQMTTVAYAFQARSADQAKGLDCTGCITDEMLGFDPVAEDDVVQMVKDSGQFVETANAVIKGGLDVMGTITAATFVGDGSGLTGISSPQGTCAEGWLVAGIDPDGTLQCVQAAAAISSVDGLSGGTINGDLEVGGTLTVNAAEVCTDDGNCGETLALLACEAGELAVYGGEMWSCSTFNDIFDPSVLPADGLNEISNDLIFNQFEDPYVSGTTPVQIKDHYPLGSTDSIVIPDAGIAQELTVSINITNSDLSTVTVKLFDPNNQEYILYEENGPGQELGATYPVPTPAKSGDLTDWVGKNPQGEWILTVIDNGFKDVEFDGQINAWSISVKTLSNKKVHVKGDLVVDGNIMAAGGGGLSIDEVGNVTASGDLEVGGKLIADVSEYTNPFGSVFTYWARKTCPDGTTKLYDGAGFGAHHGHAGPSEGICVKGGDPGPSTGYSGDILYPIHTSGADSSAPGVPANKSFWCAVCQFEEGHCFDMWGSDTCPDGWETVYNGFSYGPHYSHHSPPGHYCLDPEGFDSSIGSSGNGHLYVTRINSGHYGGNWPSSRIVKCAQCCRKQ